MVDVIRSTECTKALAVGNNVYDPLIFSPELVKFTRKEYQFLNAYRVGVPLEKAAEEAELSVEHVKRFLDRDNTRKWLQDRATAAHIKTEWEEPGKWWKLGDDVLEGRRQMTKSQVIIFQEFGARICPKKSVDSNDKTVINFNFSKESVEQAFQRQASIDAEVSDERHD